MDDNSEDLIVGIEKEIIEKFLILVKEKYPLVDKANFFLESLGVSGINIAMANQRDFLSHLSTILSNPKLDRQGRLDQLSAAEEHLRRAVIECHQKAVTLTLENVKKLYVDYRKKVLPFKERHNVLNSAPNLNSLKLTLSEIEKLREEGRGNKRRNKWNKEWEEGIKPLTMAFIKVKELESILEDYLIRADRAKSNRTQIFLTIWGIVATLIVFILSLFLFL